MDLIVRTPKVPKAGETVVGTSFDRAPGGKGANQAMAAARLGAAVTMVGRVGDDLFGLDQIESLGGAGVETRFIVKDSEAPTGVGSITLEESGQNRIVIVPGANMRCRPGDVDQAQEAFGQADIILLQFEIPEEVNEYVLRKAAEAGVPVILNPAPARPIDDSLLALVAAITPNESEAEFLTGIAIHTADDAKRAADTLRARGARRVVITLGEKGALLVDDDGTELVPSWPVDVVDTTAAGDAFNGALATGVGAGLDWKAALRLANAVGALAVTKLGAQPSMPQRAAVEAFLKERS